MKKYLFLSIFILSFFLIYGFAQAGELSSRLKGKILLKVEDAGKAYYMNPQTEVAHYLGRPDDAFRVMREQGVGITNVNLYKIPVGIRSGGGDSDEDGLPDNLEEALDLDPSKSDTDEDGFNDKDELANGYSPWGTGRQNIDNNFSNNQKGRILLQVERKGEAWYINPNDGKRYFLGRPADAFNVMKNLGLGISNSDFNSMVDETALKELDLSSDIDFSTIENAVESLEALKSDCSLASYVERMYFPEDFGKSTSSLSLIMEDEDISAEEAIDNIKISFLKTSRVFDNKISEIKIINKDFLDDNRVLVKYEVYYTDEFDNEVVFYEKLFLVNVNNEWFFDVDRYLEDAYSPENSQKYFRDSRIISDLRQLQTALELYYVDFEEYPSSLTTGQEIIGENGIIYIRVPSYQEQEAEVCAGFGEYKYVRFEDGQGYEIKYCLESGVGFIPMGANIATNERTSLGEGILKHKKCSNETVDLSTSFARDKKRISDIKQIQTALELYFMDNNTYPEIVNSGESLSSDSAVYMKSVPYYLEAENIECADFKNYEYELKSAYEYFLSYCLEGGFNEVGAGVKVATPSGPY